MGLRIDKADDGSTELAAVSTFFLGGIFSWSSPFASRFLRLSRLFRFDLSACVGPFPEGAGEDFAWDSCIILAVFWTFVGGMIGELMLDEGAEDPGC